MSAVADQSPVGRSPGAEVIDQWSDAFLLDSDVAIEHLRGRSWTSELLRLIATAGGSVCYSPVTAAEIYHGVRPGEEKATAQLFDRLPCLPVDHQVGEQAGRYLRQYRGSHGLALGDAMIAATACVHDLVLLTLNRRHYPMPDVKLANLPPPNTRSTPSS